jgi:hypothetical protein
MFVCEKRETFNHEAATVGMLVYRKKESKKCMTLTLLP